MKNRFGTTFLVLALLLGLGAAERALGESHVVSLSLHPSTALDITYHALTSDTQPYDLEEANFQATIEIETDPTFGLVATSIRFDSGSTYFTETTLQVQDMFMGFLFDVWVNIVDPFGRLTSTDLAAVPSGPNTSSFPVSALDYTLYEGFVNFILLVDPPPPPNVVLFADSNLVLPLTGSGSVLLIPNASALGAQVIVTIPLDGVPPNPWAGFEFSGDLVLTSEPLPPSPPVVLPLSPLVGWVSVFVLAAIGRRYLGRP